MISKQSIQFSSTFHEDMLACENVVGGHWSCKKTCLPKNMSSAMNFCVHKNVNCNFNIVFNAILYVISNYPFQPYLLLKSVNILK